MVNTGDQNTEKVQLERDVEYSGDFVRSYRADGKIYAYRENAEHVVVSKGRDPSTNWVKRVPATLSSVEKGDRLWTIPDNWERRIGIAETDVDGTCIYRIPDSDVEVLIQTPVHDRLIDAWYAVEAVGQTVIEYHGAGLSEEELVEYIDSYGDCLEDPVLEGLEQIRAEWSQFSEVFKEEVNCYATEAFWQAYGGLQRGVVDGWTAEPWIDTFLVVPSLEEFLEADSDVIETIAHELHDSGSVPAYPTVEISFQETSEESN